MAICIMIYMIYTIHIAPLNKFELLKYEMKDIILNINIHEVTASQSLAATNYTHSNTTESLTWRIIVCTCNQGHIVSLFLGRHLHEPQLGQLNTPLPGTHCIHRHPRMWVQEDTPTETH